MEDFDGKKCCPDCGQEIFLLDNVLENVNCPNWKCVIA
jgi:hypothetical protein